MHPDRLQLLGLSDEAAQIARHAPDFPTFWLATALSHLAIITARHTNFLPTCAPVSGTTGTRKPEPDRPNGEA